MESAANGSKLPGRTVLVVDDEEHVRTALLAATDFSPRV